MTRKDYVRFAAMLRASTRPASNETVDSIREIALRMCNIFEIDNPLFDRSRFLKACGVES